MVKFPDFRFTLSSQTLIFISLSLLFNTISSSTFQTLDNKPNFDSDIALIGDAEVVDIDNDDSYVKLTNPKASSFGLLVQNKPFRLNRSTSFNTEFTFYVSPENGDGIVLSLFSGHGFRAESRFELSRGNWLHGIEFVTSLESNVSDLNAKYVKTETGVLVPNSGEKLKSWVDYDSSSKKVEVRLGKFGELRPYSPLIAYSIDLLDKCGGEEVFVGLSSSNSKSSQFSRVFSWRFSLRNVPKGMHSIPMDPLRYSDKRDETLHDNRVYSLSIFAGLIFVTGCGALLAFVVLFMWAIIANRNTVFPGKSHSGSEDFEYEKVSVFAEEESKDGSRV